MPTARTPLALAILTDDTGFWEWRGADVDVPALVAEALAEGDLPADTDVAAVIAGIEAMRAGHRCQVCGDTGMRWRVGVRCGCRAWGSAEVV